LLLLNGHLDQIRVVFKGKAPCRKQSFFRHLTFKLCQGSFKNDRIFDIKTHQRFELHGCQFDGRFGGNQVGPLVLQFNFSPQFIKLAGHSLFEFIRNGFCVEGHILIISSENFIGIPGKETGVVCLFYRTNHGNSAGTCLFHGHINIQCRQLYGFPQGRGHQRQ